MAATEALNLTIQAAKGLEEAHRQGIVHRDIKPANLMLDRSGVVKILDMGLARVDRFGPSKEGLTSDGLILGTVEFMAPEQALNPTLVDVRSDLYGLGCTLFFLLTGQYLYAGDSAPEILVASDQPHPSVAGFRDFRVDR